MHWMVIMFDGGSEAAYAILPILCVSKKERNPLQKGDS